MSTLRLAFHASLGVLVALASPAAGQLAGATSVSVDSDSAEISFLVGTYDLDVEISFESAIGLDASSLGVSVATVDPLDTTLLSRLPDSLISVPTAFPVLLTISPPSTGALTFTDAATVELYTHDLTFTAGTPLRLFKAPDGGDFVDVTSGMGTGSYRARGQIGDFSEFIILADVRSAETVIEEKIQRLDDLLDDLDPLLSAASAAVLSTDLADAIAAWDNGEADGAIDSLEDFVDEVEASAGSGIPNVWRSSRDLRNAAGELLSAANTLLFSLRLAG